MNLLEDGPGNSWVSGPLIGGAKSLPARKICVVDLPLAMRACDHIGWKHFLKLEVREVLNRFGICPDKATFSCDGKRRPKIEISRYNTPFHRTYRLARCVNVVVFRLVKYDSINEAYPYRDLDACGSLWPLWGEALSSLGGD